MNLFPAPASIPPLKKCSNAQQIDPYVMSLDRTINSWDGGSCGPPNDQKIWRKIQEKLAEVRAFPIQGVINNEMIAAVDDDAKCSAYMMGIMRNQSMLDAGLSLFSACLMAWAWQCDYAVSQLQLALDYADIQQARIPSNQIQSFDGQHPYSAADINEYYLQQNLVALKKQEDAVAARLTGTLTPTQALAVSQTMATDPLTRKVTADIVSAVTLAQQSDVGGTVGSLARQVTQLQPVVVSSQVVPINPNVKSDITLPAGIDNTLSQQDELKRQAQLASARYQTTTESYRASEIPGLTKAAQAQAFQYWQNNYPTVQLKPEDNKLIDPRLLGELYDPAKCFTFQYLGKTLYGHADSFKINPSRFGGSRCPGMPLVSIRVTPRQRPIPQLGWLAANRWIGSIVSVIPFVGQALSLIVSQAAASQLRHFASQWRLIPDDFSPQYYPKAFYVILPLDMAQTAVAQPWYVPILNQKFQDQVNQQAINILGFSV